MADGSELTYGATKHWRQEDVVGAFAQAVDMEICRRRSENIQGTFRDWVN